VARRRWLLLLDLDGTLWDHLDVSRMEPPFARTGRWSLRDSRGEELHVYPFMAKLAWWARRSGGVVASFSWNIPWKALGALRILGLDALFDYHLIEPHPRKDLVLLRFLRSLRCERGYTFRPEEIVYFDDRDIHLGLILENVGPVRFIRSMRDCRGFEECRGLIKSLLGLGGCESRASL
jgi:magnesium-dependent phosphatase-1